VKFVWRDRLEDRGGRNILLGIIALPDCLNIHAGTELHRESALEVDRGPLSSTIHARQGKTRQNPSTKVLLVKVLLVEVVGLPMTVSD